MEKQLKNKCDFCDSFGIEKQADRTYIEGYENIEFYLCSHCAHFVYYSKEPSDLICFPQGLEEKRTLAVIQDLKEYKEKIENKIKLLESKLNKGLAK